MLSSISFSERWCHVPILPWACSFVAKNRRRCSAAFSGDSRCIRSQSSTDWENLGLIGAADQERDRLVEREVTWTGRVHRCEALAVERDVAMLERPLPFRLLSRSVTHRVPDGGPGKDRGVEVNRLLGAAAHVPDEHEGGRDALRDLRLASEHDLPGEAVAGGDPAKPLAERVGV